VPSVPVVPVDDTSAPPRDLPGYRLAVGAVGLSLVMFVIGASVIAAVNGTYPDAFWPFGSGLAGALFGILGVSPTTSKASTPNDGPPNPSSPSPPGGDPVGAVVRWLLANKATATLLAVFVVSTIAAVAQPGKPSTTLLSLASTSGGALLGSLTPSPAEATGAGSSNTPEATSARHARRQEPPAERARQA
jgi:hypothetical protein